MLTSTALVLLMTPALAFFYGGLVRNKNSLNTMMMSFVALGVVGGTWALVAYSLAFSEGGPFLGGLTNAGLAGVGTEAKGTIPHVLFMAYQGTFAIITAALISGAVVERMRFGPYVAFITLWTLLVYAPVAHWVWGGGWLMSRGVLDFAGGTVVHINAGVSALVAAVVLGPRKDYGRQAVLPHNVPFVLLGAGLLWFGWFGFNAGSALGAKHLAGYAFVNTNTATAAAMLGWLLVEKLRDGKATTLGAASGAVAGLVAITPCAGFVSPLGSIAIGFGARAICAYGILLKRKLGYDDALDVVGVHLIGGIVGSLAVGLFATTDTNSLGADGLFYGGGMSLLGKQAIAVAAVAGYSFAMTLIIGFVLKLVTRMRLTPEEEQEGMDFVLHGETAYELANTGGGGGGFGSGGHGRPGSVTVGATSAGVQA